MGFNSGFKGLISVLDGDERPASRPGHFTARKEPSVPSEQESGWTTEFFWKFYVWDESLASVQIRKPKRPARNLVTIATTAWLLSYKCHWHYSPASIA